MRRLLERVRAWLADAQVWLSAASPRERRLILLAGGAALLFVYALGLSVRLLPF